MLGGAREAVAHFGTKCKTGGERHGPVFRPVTQVVGRAVHLARGTYQLSGIHPILWIPDRLEFAQSNHELRAEHRRQQFGLRLAVAVLARERAAVLHHQLRRLAEKAAPVRHALGRAQLEGDARVDAAVAEVPVERGAVAGAVDERLELALARLVLGGEAAPEAGSISSTVPAVEAPEASIRSIVGSGGTAPVANCNPVEITIRYVAFVPHEPLGRGEYPQILNVGASLADSLYHVCIAK